MDGQVLLRCGISKVLFSRGPVCSELSLFDSTAYENSYHSILIFSFCRHLTGSIPCVVLLLVCNGVGGYLCSMSSKVIWICTACYAFINWPATSDLAAGDMMFLILRASKYIGPLNKLLDCCPCYNDSNICLLNCVILGIPSMLHLS